MNTTNIRFTLILGAGASFDFGLPLGEGLREIIARDLDIKFADYGRSLKSGSYEIVEALRSLVRTAEGGSGDINPHRRAAVQISEAMPYSSSIDEYVERHSDDKLKAQCAKLAISKAILEKEKASKIYGDPLNPDVDPLRNANNTWLAFFLRDVTRGLTKNDVADALTNFSIVNFNYDRCVEHFIYHWLRRIYEFDAPKASEIVCSMSIYHPYGKIGDLPFEAPNTNIPFGGKIDGKSLLHMMARIRTYSETVEEDRELNSALDRMRIARKLVFVGFGFHRQNMNLLSIASRSDRVTARCYATTVQIPEAKWEVFRGRIGECLGIDGSNLFVERNSVSCNEFWNEFGENIIN